MIALKVPATEQCFRYDTSTHMYTSVPYCWNGGNKVSQLPAAIPTVYVTS